MATVNSGGSPMNSMAGSPHQGVPYHSINDDVVTRSPPWYGRCCHTDIRLVNRNSGRSNIKKTGFNTSYFGYITDSFTTLINSRWWVIVAFFVGAYICSWLFFACFWTVAAYADGRFNGTCIINLSDFSSALLFSIEVQNTIGFGNKFVANDCHWGILILMAQCLLGLLLDSLLLGLIFAKITRPRNRRKTIIFSRNAVIREDNDGQQVLEMRIANLRQSQIVEGHIRLRLYWYKLVDPQNMFYELEEYDLDCGYDTGQDRLLLLTPVLLKHPITESSPLYGLTQTELSALDIEVVVILEGIVEATGLTVQALWSYTKNEILFNHKFVSVVHRNPETLRWEVDLDRIDDIRAVTPPTTDNRENGGE